MTGRKTLAKTSPSPFSVKRKREDGNAVDMMGAVFVCIMLFAMILATAAYSALVERKLGIDNTVKEHLYLTEQYGYLRGLPSGNLPLTRNRNLDGSADTSGLTLDAASLVKTLMEGNGCKTVTITNHTTKNQQAYGNKVEVEVIVVFDSPMYKVLGTNDPHAWFKLFGLDDEITYTVSYTSTSRW